MPTWDAKQYLQFADERTRPCRDLIGRVALAEPRRIIDLGCGPGNSTAALMERWAAAEITGMDSSPEMIASAAKAYLERRWVTGDIASWSADTPYDLVFSNAALQWVGDHAVLFPRLVRQVAPGGALAMQELAASATWAGRFPKKVREWFVHEPAFYYDAVAPLVSRLDLWTTEYFHVMENARAIVEWYKGTGLRPFLDVLSVEDQQEFLAEYHMRLETVYPRRADGRVLFPFLRMFLIAYV